MEVGQRAADLGAEGEEAFGAVAVGDLHEDGIGAFEQRNVPFRAAGDEGGLVLALVEGGAIEQLQDGDVVVQGALDLAVALDDEEGVFIAVRTLAELDDFLDAGVLEAGNDLGEGRHGYDLHIQYPMSNIQSSNGILPPEP